MQFPVPTVLGNRLRFGCKTLRLRSVRFIVFVCVIFLRFALPLIARSALLRLRHCR